MRTTGHDLTAQHEVPARRARRRGVAVRLVASVIGALALLVAAWFGAATSVTAQGADASEVYNLHIRADNTDDGETTFGARFTVTTEDGAYLGACTLEGNADSPPWVYCSVDVPKGIPVIVWEDPDSLPSGYAPAENPLIFDTTYPTTTPHQIDVAFQNVPRSGSVSTAQTSDVTILTRENGQPATDACYVLVDYSNVGCDEDRDGQVTFQDVPFGTYTVRQTADLGPGRSVNDFTIDVRGNVNQAGWEVFYTSVSSGSGGSTAPGGPVDISLITREPEGDLLTGACYVLVGFSIEGCDENGDGQVTFADIPFGTYTVRQTQAPAGYPTINDFDIIVAGTGYMEAPSTGVPLGFVVKQAPEQNAPDTRNVSVVFLDMLTHERVTTGACVELIGASNVGCDEDLLDGQVDFLDVPAGGPYELRFSNLPAGYEVGMVGGPLAVTINAGPGDPANVMVFVLLAAPAGAGSAPIEPADNISASGAQDPASTSGVTEATVLMTFRGCPEGFVPDIDDPYTACTIPLDAPDASFISWGDDGQGGMSITGLERRYDGAYVYTAGPDTMSLQLSGLAPVVRNAYQVIGADGVNGDIYTVNLVAGEIREVFVFYYYE